MTGLLIIGALVLLVGLVFSSEATIGASLMGVACFCAIVVRIIQSSRQQRNAEKPIREYKD